MKHQTTHYTLLLFLLLEMIAGCATNRPQYPNKIATQSEIKPAIQSKPIAEPETDNLTTTQLATVQTGRYSAVHSKPTHSQRELLEVVITVTIPDEMRTIGQTVRYLLKRSGYRLVNPAPQQTALTELLFKPLPEVHRRLGPMSLKDALIILTAPAFVLTDDPVHRLISYQLDNKYKAGVTL